MRQFIHAVALLAFSLFCLPALAAPLEIGDAIPKLSAKDQHGSAYAFTNGTSCLLIAMDMSSAKAANQKLAEQGAGFLEKHNAAYLMDIHTMPDIGKFFALRKMRKYPQRILLIETSDTMNWVPVKPGHISVLTLTPAGQIKQIRFWNSSSEPVTSLFNSTPP